MQSSVAGAVDVGKCEDVANLEQAPQTSKMGKGILLLCISGT